MGLPSKKRTNTSKKKRASHFALKKSSLAKCSECKAERLPHRACPKCGSYRGKKNPRAGRRAARKLRNTIQV